MYDLRILRTSAHRAGDPGQRMIVGRRFAAVILRRGKGRQPVHTLICQSMHQLIDIQ